MITRDDIERDLREIIDFGADHRSWLVPAALLLILNVLFFLGLTARSASKAAALELEVRSTEQELSAALRELDRNDRKRALGALVEREYQDLYDNVLHQYSEHFQRVRLELESIMKQVSIGATQISYARAELPEFRLIRNTISLPLKGDYHSLRRLLSLIEQSEQFLIIDSISLADSSNEGTELNLSISLVAFFYEPDLDKGFERRRPA